MKTKVAKRIWILNEEVKQFKDKPVDLENHNEYILAGTEHRSVCREIKKIINKECFSMTYNGVTKTVILADDLLKELKKLKEVGR